MADILKWKYCVVGNIVKTHIDDNGILRYGTSAYTGGTKVYLCGKYWNDSFDTITVIGLNRNGRKYRVSDVKIELIENVRLQKTFKKAVLDIMDNFEFFDCWWHRSKEDKEDAMRFIQEWNAKQN